MIETNKQMIETDFMSQFTKEEIVERIVNFDFTIKDGLDLYSLLSMHGIVSGNLQGVNILETRLEIYKDGLTNDFPYFDDNWFHIIMLNEKSEVVIEFYDYGEPIDIKERNQLKRYLKDVLSQAFYEKIVFVDGYSGLRIK